MGKSEWGFGNAECGMIAHIVDRLTPVTRNSKPATRNLQPVTRMTILNPLPALLRWVVVTMRDFELKNITQKRLEGI